MPKRYLYYVEGLLFAIGPAQIQVSFSAIAALPDLHLGHDILPADVRWPDKRRLFRRRLFLVHRGSFSTGAGRDLGGLGLYAQR
jgi:hypothetical protein